MQKLNLFWICPTCNELNRWEDERCKKCDLLQVPQPIEEEWVVLGELSKISRLRRIPMNEIMKEYKEFKRQGLNKKEIIEIMAR